MAGHAEVDMMQGMGFKYVTDEEGEYAVYKRTPKAEGRRMPSAHAKNVGMRYLGLTKLQAEYLFRSSMEIEDFNEVSKAGSVKESQGYKNFVKYRRDALKRGIITTMFSIVD